MAVVSSIFKNNSHPSTTAENPPTPLPNPPTPSFFPPTSISTPFSVFFFFYKNQREREDKNKPASPNRFFYDIQKLGDFWPFLRKVGGWLGDGNRYLEDGESAKSLNLLNSAVRVGVIPQSLNVSPPVSLGVSGAVPSDDLANATVGRAAYERSKTVVNTSALENAKL
jgi:hypothetical protein